MNDNGRATSGPESNSENEDFIEGIELLIQEDRDILDALAE